MVFGQFQPARPGGMAKQKAVGFTRSPYQQRGGIIGRHVLMSGYSPGQMRYIQRHMAGTKRRKANEPQNEIRKEALENSNVSDFGKSLNNTLPQV